MFSAPTATQVSVERTSATLPTYNLPATYYYEPTTIGYHVAGMSGSLVARTYNSGTPYTVQATTTPTVRPGVATQVQGNDISLLTTHFFSRPYHLLIPMSWSVQAS